jgi:uncharacterized protein YbbC (DUF1343 family)
MNSIGNHQIRRGDLAARWAMLLATSLAASGCAGGSDSDAAPAARGAAAAPARVEPGIDVLLGGEIEALRGRRVGLITNHTGLSSDGRSTIDVLHEHPEFELVALFGPEHGLRGTAEAGEHVAGGRDEKTGLPAHSLYGEVQAPTADMLRDIDVLVFDIQDIGTRYYTYPWTMILSLRAAAENGKAFVVLDRPNPLGGELMHGNVQDSSQLSFVGLYPVPMRHGLTIGELARLVNGEEGLNAQLTVIPARGWQRSQWYDETGVPWVAPSPNMPNLESATHYPGTCLFEGTNLSVGRGTQAAFAQIGAPWLNAEEVVRRMNARQMPGVRFEAVTFTPQDPGDQKYGGQAIAGIRFVTTDRSLYDPAVAGIAALVDIRAVHGDSLTFRDAHFDRLAGTTRVREMVARGAEVAEITSGWAAQVREFAAVRSPYLLY